MPATATAPIAVHGGPVDHQDEIASLIPKIQSEHRQVIQAMQKGLDHAIKAGEYLIHARKLWELNGGWTEWIEKNFEFSIRTAQAYMQCYKHRTRLRKLKVEKFGEALRVLAKKKKPRDQTTMPTETTTPTGPTHQTEKATLTITKKALDEAMKPYFLISGTKRKDLLDFLAAIGVIVK